MANNRKHHTSGHRAYLQRFAAGRTLMEVVLPGEQRHPVSVYDATTQTGFYDVIQEDGIRTSAMEKGLAQIESGAEQVLRKIIDQNIWPLSTDDRAAIAVWIAFLFLRTPRVRQDIAEIQVYYERMNAVMLGPDGIRKMLGEGASDHDVQQEIKVIKELAPENFIDDSSIHVPIMINSSMKVVPYLILRPWSIIRFERKSLLTCDNPVILLQDSDRFHRPIGVRTASQITVPLSRKVVLIMGQYGEPHVIDALRQERYDLIDWRLMPNTKIAKELNQFTVANAYEKFFHHPNDEFSGLFIPEFRKPRITATNINELFTQRYGQ